MTMKKRVTIVLDVSSEDDVNMTDKFIKNDLETEIGCASNSYDIVSFHTETLHDEDHTLDERQIELLRRSLDTYEYFIRQNIGDKMNECDANELFYMKEKLSEIIGVDLT